MILNLSIKKKMVFAVVIWSVIILTVAMWNRATEKRKTRELAQKEAITTFNKDQVFRFWAANHGGVYVPITKDTPPNPYLAHVSERDFTSPLGKKFTLMNPAYMLQQIMSEYANLNEIKGHITSLNPINPLNKPSDWEKNALKQFEKGVKEVSEIVSRNDELFLKLIRPMVTTEGCLKCHAKQGYKEGDIRGGLGVSVPMKPYLVLEKTTLKNLLISLSLFWALVSCQVSIDG